MQLIRFCLMAILAVIFVSQCETTERHRGCISFPPAPCPRPFQQSHCNNDPNLGCGPHKLCCQTQCNGFQSSMCESEIANFFKNRSVFLTGATGFLGKATVEKLLRGCPSLANIYVLIRCKRGEGVGDRHEKLLQSSLYDRLRKENPAALSKIVAISGDLTQPNLGISASDLALLSREVSIVIHSAATVKFDEDIRLAIDVNLGATKRLVDICKGFTHLVALVHISTAYANCDLKNIDETIYPTTVEPLDILKGVKWMDDAMVQHVTPKLLGNKPNTYTFTKALAEKFVSDESGSLPICIVRPSIVTATCEEPVPGWVDNLNAATGVLVAIGKGVLHTLLGDAEKIGDVIPLDYCVNLILAAAWDTANTQPNNLMVYNCCSGQLNPIRWGTFTQYWANAARSYPCNEPLWYPFVAYRANRHWNSICAYFLHYLPACAIDFSCRVTQRKTDMLRIYNKLSKSIYLLSYFTLREWNFSIQNTTHLYKKLSDEDQKLFNFNFQDINWEKYMENYCIGARKYLLKEDCSSLPAAQKHIRKKFWIHTLTKLFIFLLIWGVITSLSSASAWERLSKI